MTHEPNTAVSAPYTPPEGVVEAMARAIDPDALRTADEWFAARPPRTPEQMRLSPGDTMEARTLRIRALADCLYAENERRRSAARQTAAIALAASPLADLVNVLTEFFTSGDFDIQTTGDEAATQAWLTKARTLVSKAKGETL